MLKSNYFRKLQNFLFQNCFPLPCIVYAVWRYPDILHTVVIMNQTFSKLQCGAGEPHPLTLPPSLPLLPTLSLPFSLPPLSLPPSLPPPLLSCLSLQESSNSGSTHFRSIKDKMAGPKALFRGSTVQDVHI